MRYVVAAAIALLASFAAPAGAVANEVAHGVAAVMAGKLSSVHESQHRRVSGPFSDKRYGERVGWLALKKYDQRRTSTLAKQALTNLLGEGELIESGGQHTWLGKDGTRTHLATVDWQGTSTHSAHVVDRIEAWRQKDSTRTQHPDEKIVDVGFWGFGNDERAVEHVRTRYTPAQRLALLFGPGEIAFGQGGVVSWKTLDGRKTTLGSLTRDATGKATFRIGRLGQRVRDHYLGEALLSFSNRVHHESKQYAFSDAPVDDERSLALRYDGEYASKITSRMRLRTFTRGAIGASPIVDALNRGNDFLPDALAGLVTPGPNGSVSFVFKTKELLDHPGFLVPTGAAFLHELTLNVGDDGRQNIRHRATYLAGASKAP